MPSTVLCRNVSVAALPCVEKDGFIWVWPGEGVPPEVSAGNDTVQEQRYAETCLLPVMGGTVFVHGLLVHT